MQKKEKLLAHMCLMQAFFFLNNWEQFETTKKREMI